MRRHIALAIIALVLGVSACEAVFAQKQSQRSAKPDPSTYDPIIAMDRTMDAWEKIYLSIPEDERGAKGLEFLLTRNSGESDEAYAFRVYSVVNASKSLVKAKDFYQALSADGYGKSHRWLYIDESNGLMYFADLRTSLVSVNPSLWFQTRKLGVLKDARKLELDCGGKQTRVMSFTAYRPDGSVHGSDSSPMPWELVVPGTIAEAILDFGCT